MPGPLTLAWDERLTGYDFGPGHPLAPVRVELTMALARELGVLAQPSVSMLDPAPAERDELELVHDPAYIDAVRQAGRDRLGNLRYGLGTPDNPVFAGMHEASALVAGATLAAARAVWPGEARHAANIAGGLHHAMRRVGQRLLRLQRPGHRDQLAAGRRCPADRVRGSRRAPR